MVLENLVNSPLKVVLVIVALPVVVYLLGAIKERKYRLKCWQRGIALPAMSKRQMFGSGRMYRLLKSSLRSKLLQDMENDVDASGKQNILSQSIFFGDTLLTIDPENIKHILSTNFRDFNIGLRSKQLSIVLGDGIFTEDGQAWAHSRAMLKPQFARYQITNFDMFDKHVEELLAVFRKQGAGTYSNRLFEVRQLFQCLTLDFSVEFLLGESIDSFKEDRMPLDGDPENPSPHDFIHALAYASEFVIRRAQIGSLYFLADSPKFRKHIDTCHKFMDVFVRRALKIQRGEEKQKDTSRYVFINELAKDTQDPIQLRDQCMNILSAGRSTTASLLTMCMFYLARYPDVWAKLKEEVIASFGEDKSGINPNNIRSCQYLRAVVNEVIRIRSIVPLNVRQPNKDVTLPRGGGPDGDDPILVEKGTTILMSFYTMQRSPMYWGQDAKSFNPDRWINAKYNDHHPWAFTPFGGGPRICLGQQLATNETYYTIIRLAQTFERIFTSYEEAQKEPLFNSAATLIVKDGVWVNFE
jgi:cytochrome P450